MQINKYINKVNVCRLPPGGTTWYVQVLLLATAFLGAMKHLLLSVKSASNTIWPRVCNSYQAIRAVVFVSLPGFLSPNCCSWHQVVTFLVLFEPNHQNNTAHWRNSSDLTPCPFKRHCRTTCAVWFLLFDVRTINLTHQLYRVKHCRVFTGYLEPFLQIPGGTAEWLDLLGLVVETTHTTTRRLCAERKSFKTKRKSKYLLFDAVYMLTNSPEQHWGPDSRSTVKCWWSEFVLEPALTFTSSETTQGVTFLYSCLQVCLL